MKFLINDSFVRNLVMSTEVNSPACLVIIARDSASLVVSKKRLHRFAPLEKEAKCNSVPDVCKQAEVTAR